MDVSPRSVESASKVLEKGTPELIQAVKAGRVSVSAAAEVADLPTDEQTQAVAGGKKGVADKAKERRKAKKQEKKPAAEATKEPEVLTIRKDMDAKTMAQSLIDFLGLKQAQELRKSLRMLVSELAAKEAVVEKN
jgi:hypothetical protein